ncbi:MAG TPA: Vms1/Ankzf1 family peptidyl-tRNA hydrolase [Solirubrobacteraceae bacterium]|jgi:peptide chain release factor subunit 1
MPLVNDLDEARLRDLAAARATGETVLSLFLDLDPERFATPRARKSEVDSLLDNAHALIERDTRPHPELIALRDSLERAREILAPPEESSEWAPQWAQGAHAVALFLSEPLNLEELLRLDVALPSGVEIGDAPAIAPLTLAEPAGEGTIVALVDERSARFFRSSPQGLREALVLEDDVHSRVKKGGWSQARYERSQHEDVRQHLAHVGATLLETLRQVPYERLLVACAQPLWSNLLTSLHPSVRERLAAPRLSLDVSDAGIADVDHALEQALEQQRERHEQERLDELQARIDRPADRRAATGFPDVLQALVERRVETLLHEFTLDGEGVACERCGWLGLEGERCPLDGEPLRRSPNIVEDAVRAAVAQDAEVLALRDRPDLRPFDGIAALLRF